MKVTVEIEPKEVAEFFKEMGYDPGLVKIDLPVENAFNPSNYWQEVLKTWTPNTKK